MAKAGRKPYYEEIILPRIEEIKQWLSEGKTDKEIALLLGITPKTFSKYKNSISSFNSIVKKNRQPCVEVLENSMFDSAIGFTKTIKEPIKRKIIEYDNGKKVKEEEIIEQVEKQIYIPPNITAQIFLLKNWGEYTNEPKILAIKKEELKLRKEISDSNKFNLD